MAERSTRKGPDVESVEKFWMAANYISAGILYLKRNCLLTGPRSPDDFKSFVVGHWGASPGINAIYAHLSDLIRRTERPIRLVVGTGHAGPAILANLYLDGSLQTYYPEYAQNETGLTKLFSDFGIAGGWDTEIAPEYPGMSYIGGELGAALAFAQGCVMNDKDSLTACVIGDGELETSLTQASWQGFKFLGQHVDGAVLPIINANGNKMGSQSLLGMLSRDEKVLLFKGQGLKPIFAGPDHKEIAESFDKAYSYLSGMDPLDSFQQPVIIMETPKGWTAPVKFGATPFAGSYKSHKPLLRNPAKDPEEAEMVWTWLEGYKPRELFDSSGAPNRNVTACLPSPMLRLGGTRAQKASRTESSDVKPQKAGYPIRSTDQNNATVIEEQLLSLFRNDPDLLVFCPDEISSNQMGSLVKANGMKFGKLLKGEIQMNPNGRVVEILNEHLCFAWSQGYSATGRRSVIISYEAFASIFDSMAAQYIKFLNRSKCMAWRPKNPSINIILTSLGWRNCATHQNPGFVDGLLGRGLSTVRVYAPTSPESTKSFLRQMLDSFDLLNVMVVSKHNLPRLSLCNSKADPALRMELWRTLEQRFDAPHHISLVALGDCMAEECLLAKDIICQEDPNLSVQVIAVHDLSLFDRNSEEKDGLLNAVKDSVSVVWAYNGYIKTIRALLWGKLPTPQQIILGYMDKGKAVAGLERYVENQVSRYDIVLGAVSYLHKSGLHDCSEIIRKCKDSIIKFSLDDA